MPLRLLTPLFALLLACTSARPTPEAGAIPIGVPSVTVAGEKLDLPTAALLDSADVYLAQPPVPLTTYVSERSAGGPHDFYSEGDYWWPNPASPDSPYVRRDGQTNPANFNAHRGAMRDLARWVAALTAAYEVTGETRYADQALAHLQAWFLTEATAMNPSLLYAQAISGRVTGRGIGIIDTIHLIEVARAIQRLRALGYLGDPDYDGLVAWFDAYATWLTTHPYGIDERDHGNNHSTWWAAQVAAFAQLAERDDLTALARNRFVDLLSAQSDPSGGFPEELGRTKPYSYTLFNLEGYSVLADLASAPAQDLWRVRVPARFHEDGEPVPTDTATVSLRDAWAFIMPALLDKSTWTYPPDIAHFEELPIQTTGLLLAARAYDDEAYLELWKALSPLRPSEEADRTFPLRQPVLWVN